MRALRRLAVVATLVAAGCQSLDSVAGFVQDLQVRGLAARAGQEFNGSLLGGNGRTVCVGDESVSVYEFPDAAAAEAAARTINRDDPSFVGNGIVEWIGPPRFWLRGRLIIQYVGADAGLDAALRAALGPPYAEAVGWGRQPPLKHACQ